mmetsp:Transcript_3985/g.8575  ORF Transcript_3985/g.8575 Transcript_3985/m.8575 type:complete len:149 (-) Transcript_3985:391-837(-)
MLFDILQVGREDPIVASTEEAKMKALNIIQLLNQSRTYLAIEEYERCHKYLQQEYKHEIFVYVHAIFGDDRLLPCLFPDLPPPKERIEFEDMTTQDRGGVPTPAVESPIRKAKKARVALDWNGQRGGREAIRSLGTNHGQELYPCPMR